MSTAVPPPQVILSTQRPLILRWTESDNPLPVRAIVHPRSRHGQAPHAPPPSLPSGPAGQPFDFTGHLRRLCVDVVARCALLRHIDVGRVLIGITQARNGRSRGLQSRVTPLRFENGRLTRRRGGVTYQVQRYFHGTHEFLYLLTFYLPRFLDQPFNEKLITLFHELYHIGPAFDGDLRRHEGRYAIHTHSQRGYDRQMAEFARAYLAAKPDPSLFAFLRMNFAQLQTRHGSVAGIVVPRPKVIPIDGVH